MGRHGPGPVYVGDRPRGEASYSRPTLTDIRTVVAMAAGRGLPVGINRRGRIHLVRSLAEYDALADAS